MARKKKTQTDSNTDRHKRQGFQLRLHPLLLQQLEILVDRNATNRTAEISTALRKYLQENSLWPPKQLPSGQND